MFVFFPLPEVAPGKPEAATFSFGVYFWRSLNWIFDTDKAFQENTSTRHEKCQAESNGKRLTIR